MRSPCATFGFLSTLLGSLVVSGCNLDNLGDPPPDADLYLPTGMLLSAQADDSAPKYLYVINSNFDLRYNRGSLQAFDLDVLANQVDRCVQNVRDCESAGGDAQHCELPCQIQPGFKADDDRPLLADEVLIPSLATSYSVTPDHTRLYVATRTDATLTFVDLNEQSDSREDVLSCGDSQSDRRCDDAHRSGGDSAASPRGLTFPTEPVGMVSFLAKDAAPDLDESVSGNFVLVAHRAGQVSLFHDDGNTGPRLLDILQLSNTPLELTGVDFDAAGHLGYLSIHARGVVSSAARQLARVALNVRVGADGNLDATQAFNAGPAVIDGVASFADTRAVRINPARPDQLLVTGGLPASLLFVDVGTGVGTQTSSASSAASNSNVLRAREVVNVGGKPLRMTLGRLRGRDVVAVSCFDSGQLYLIDTDSSSVVAVIRNLDGPFDLAMDSVRERLYLADFRSSTVQVVDLSGVAADGAGERVDAPIIAVLGIPKVVQELQ
jgi:DNA-binding beta-propeller fold protein YncE